MKFLLGVALAASFLSPIKIMSEEQNYTFEDAVTEALDYVRIRNNKLDNFLRENNSSRYKLDWKSDPPTISFYNSKSELIKKYVFVVIGTYAPEKGTWKWGWSNLSYSKENMRRSWTQREIGNYLTPLKEIYERDDSFAIDPDDALRLAAFSVRQFNGEAYYITSDGKNIEGNPLETYLLLLNP